jgi:N-methylhydantoinase A
MVDVRSIGAGGGSIARLTPEGGLRVGPDSAGAEPGPVCYGRGGADPTVTDAHLVLGRLGEALLGGALPLDRERARAAIGERIARPLSLTVEAAAAGILEILDTHMVGAIRAISVERGHDPREFALVASGGAGGLHAGRLAALLGIPVAVVPRHAGVLSTLGLLASEIRHDYVRTLRQGPGDWDVAGLEAAFADLERQARGWLAGEGIPEGDRRLERSADLRYVHQGYELTVPVAAGPLTPATVGEIEAAFHRLHAQLYTYATPEAPVELVNVRVAALGPAWGLTPGPLAPRAAAPPPEPAGRRAVYFAAAGGWVGCPVWGAAALEPGFETRGPAVLAQDLATIVVEPGHRARVDAHGHVILHLPGGEV